MPKFITFSFDDGTTQDFQLVEILNRFGLKATFNLNSGLFGQENVIHQRGLVIQHNKINAGDVKALYEGHEVAVHTVTHPNLTELDEEEVVYEINQDKETLEQILEQKIIGMAYPCGGVNHDERVMEIINRRTSIKYARTIDSTFSFEVPENFLKWNPTCHARHEDIFELAEEFDKLDGERNALFYIWAHSYNLESEGLWDRFTDFCKMISSLRNVQFLTNSQVYNAL